MIRLCTSEVDHDASVALFDGQKLLYAISEERLSRVKLQSGFPRLAAEMALRRSGLSVRDVEQICIAKPRPRDEIRSIFGRLRDYSYFANGTAVHDGVLDLLALRLYKQPRTTKNVLDMHSQITHWLVDQGVESRRVKREYNHHFLHAASAYYASGFVDCLAITADGQGGGVTASVYECRGGKLRRLHEVEYPHSMGSFYGAVTKALGFKLNRHEGKITGLAAYEPPAPEVLDYCRSIAKSHGHTFTVQGIYGQYYRLRMLAKKYTPAQIAAAFQIVLEEVLGDFGRHYVEKTGLTRVALAGGVFANVKLNQRIKDIPGVEECFVFPAMSDCGLAWGAGAYEARHHAPFEPQQIRDVYWGPSYTEEQMLQALRAADLPFERVQDVPGAVGDLLADGHIMWRFDGAMEFGPRALGNRSILYRTQDRTVNDWLNKILKRTEFMPFAPVTLAEEAHRCYTRLDPGRRTAYFMTMTFDCTTEMKEWSPAAVHVDGTARPQLIDEATNPAYYGIVKRYYERTGVPSIINTSYNMHEEPIVCSPEDAIRAYTTGKVGVLSMGPFLVKLHDSPHRSH